ncbi:hypothetical protein Hanom_Chr09g00837721 [Helianthus anomalus]
MTFGMSNSISLTNQTLFSSFSRNYSFHSISHSCIPNTTLECGSITANVCSLGNCWDNQFDPTFRW